MITQSFGWGKHCCICQVCLFLILALFMKAKKCHWLLHQEHFLSALLSSWRVYLAALKGYLLPLLGIWAPLVLVPDASLPLPIFALLCSPTTFRICLSNKVSWLSEILAILAWNLSQVSIHTLTESCLHVIIEELCRSVCIQWCIVRRQAKLLHQRRLSGDNKTKVYFSLT